MLGIDGKVLMRPPKRQIFLAVLQNCKKTAVKHYLEKRFLRNFMDLSKIICSQLCEETYSPF